MSEEETLASQWESFRNDLLEEVDDPELQDSYRMIFYSGARAATRIYNRAINLGVIKGYPLVESLDKELNDFRKWLEEQEDEGEHSSHPN